MGLFDFIGSAIGGLFGGSTTGASDTGGFFGSGGFFGDLLGAGLKVGTGLLAGNQSQSGYSPGDLLSFGSQFYKPRQMAEREPGQAQSPSFLKSEDMDQFYQDWLYRMGRFAFLEKITPGGK